MRPKYEIIEIDKCEITVDVSLLSKTDELFFNATEIAKPFDKRPDDFWKQQQNKDYLDALITLSGGNKENYVHTKTGRKYGGTWLHKDLALQFARWLSPILAVKLDKWTLERIEKERDWQRKRLEAKTGFLPMTNAITKVHDPVMFYHFSTECDMLNIIVLGMTAKKFKALHSVDNVRDALDASQLADLSRLQIIGTGLIEIGMSYEDRQYNLIKCHERELLAEISLEAA